MPDNREVLDAIVQYIEARKVEHAVRSKPPEVTAEQYASLAVEKLNAHIDSRIGTAIADKDARDAARLRLG